MHLTVRIPATTANLGPGFDCLGLALDLWNEIELETSGDHLIFQIEGEGQNNLPQNEHNAIFSAMNAYASLHQTTLPNGLHIHCRNQIPVSSGLGSSAAAVVAGGMLANTLLGLPFDPVEMLEFATQIEGHPDNAAPCILGGLTAAMLVDGNVISRSLPVEPLPLCLTLPDFHLPTSQARAAIPLQVPVGDAVFNISRSVMTVEALRTGDLDVLSLAMQDRIHQPYRLKLIPGAREALAAAQASGAVAGVLSGAGPSLLAVGRTENDLHQITTAMEAAFHKAGLTCRSFFPQISFTGAQVFC